MSNLHDTEIWLPMTELPWQYEISNFGRIRSARYCNIIKPNISNSGYYRTALYHGKNNKKSIYKNYSIHRLVALCFLNNPLSLPAVNHIDGNKLNNRADNLEWCTHSQNSLHNFKVGLQKPVKSMLGKFGCDHNRAKQVVQYDSSGNLIATFGSAKEAQRMTGISQGQISRVCRGERPNTKGYVFKYTLCQIEGISDAMEYKDMFTGKQLTPALP